MHNKQYIIFLTAITMVFAACGANQPEINPNPNVDSIHIDARQLIGMWKISFSDDLEDDIPGYYQFNSDGTFEYLTFLFSIDFHSNIHFEGYYCQTGTYSVDDSLILFSPNRDARWYSYKNDVLRILGIFERGNAFQYSIVSGSENQLLLAAGEYTCDLMKLSQKPDEWDSVFFEPEKDLSEDALIGNWDLLNKFTKDYWWWYGLHFCKS